MLDIESFLKNLTHFPGVYQMLAENGEILYVGKAKDLKKRVSSYFRKQLSDNKTVALMKHVKNVDITVTRSEHEALLLECNLIKEHRPRYNVLLRDDKSYPYIFINNDQPYPRIDVYRGIPKKNGKYFGPYPNVSSVREMIRIIQKVFKIRTCHDGFFSNRTRPCLHYQIGLCSGPCVAIISPEEYAQDIHHAILFLQGKNNEVINEITANMEKAAQVLNYELAASLRNQITQIREIQQRQYVSAQAGDADIIGIASEPGAACIQLLVIRLGRILGSRSYYPTVPAHSNEQEIISAFITQHYLAQQIHDIPNDIILPVHLDDHLILADALSEQAKHKVNLASSVRGERKKWLETATASAQQAVATRLQNKANLTDRLNALQTLLALEKTPKRIECFDISHTLGEATVASCVVFNSLGAAKSDYRRFNITGITPGDDYAAMQQALTRRYHLAHEAEHKLPEVLLIDGGLGQLHVAEKVLAELKLNNIILVGVAKGEGRKPGYETLHIPGREPIHLTPDSIALHFIQQIRDEAHRFAITGHRTQRDKARRTSTLESIPGIGAKRRRDLLRHFGGIQALNRASLEEIMKVPGINSSLAQRIFEALHNAAV